VILCLLSAAIAAAALLLASSLVIRASARGRTYNDVADIPHRKAGLLLGCPEHFSDRRPNPFFGYRIQAAAALFRAGKVDYLIVSGDNRRKEYDEPTDMKNALLLAGVPESRICCDYAGFRTLDSVVRAKEVFGQTEITIISQQFHNQRAIFIASHRGLDAIAFNAKDVGGFAGFRVNLREHMAQVRAVLDILIFGTRPKFLGPKVEVG